MQIDAKKVIRMVLEDLGQRELARVKKIIGSRALRAAIRLIINESEERGDLFVPHYWAVWYHDGRGSVSPVSARKLVFFDNPSDDPRLRGRKRPVRESEVKRLTKRQYEDGLRVNRERAKRGLERPFMWVVDSVGPSKPRPFFAELQVNAKERADIVAFRVFQHELLTWVDSDPTMKSETRVADFGLRI